jgi:hypothetical protein
VLPSVTSLLLNSHVLSLMSLHISQSSESFCSYPFLIQNTRLTFRSIKQSGAYGLSPSSSPVPDSPRVNNIVIAGPTQLNATTTHTSLREMTLDCKS